MKWIIVGAVIILLCSVIVAYNGGYDAGKESSNLDEVYESYLDSILPGDEGSFSYIVLRNNTYFVGHNINEIDWTNLDDAYDIRFPVFTWQFFNDKPIFHKPSGGMFLMERNGNESKTLYLKEA